MKAALLLSGSGVYDGTEIHEAVFALLALAEEGFEVQAFAPDIKQLHVINHITGEEMAETRNVLIESARLVRGDIKNLEELDSKDYDALVMPGGFGAAKNLSSWAVDGPSATIRPGVKKIITAFIGDKKPIVSLCISPVVIALALSDQGVEPALTVGTTSEDSPYDISEINAALETIGAKAHMKKVSEVMYDEKNKIITSPCYMQNADITQIRSGISLAVKKLASLVA